PGRRRARDRRAGLDGEPHRRLARISTRVRAVGDLEPNRERGAGVPARRQCTGDWRELDMGHRSRLAQGAPRSAWRPSRRGAVRLRARRRTVRPPEPEHVWAKARVRPLVVDPRFAPYGVPRKPSTTRTNFSGSSKYGRWPLCSNTSHCEPGMALWIFHAVLGATLMS